MSTRVGDPGSSRDEALVCRDLSKLLSGEMEADDEEVERSSLEALLLLVDIDGCLEAGDATLLPPAVLWPVFG